MASAAAATSQPHILTRAQWGADERLRQRVTELLVHHQGGLRPPHGQRQRLRIGDVPKILRGIYAYHTKSNGWSDIGYNFLVDRFGRLWEGRYGGIAKPVMGAHTGGFNVDTFAVSAIGNYDKVAAPPVMTHAIARLLAWKLSLHYRDPAGKTTLTSTGGGTSRYAAGTKVTIDVVSAHRNMGYTSCPGTNLYAKMPTIRTEVRSLLGAGLVAPSVRVYSTTINAQSGVVRAGQASHVTVTQRATGRVIRESDATGAFSLPLPRQDRYKAGLEAGVYDVTMTSKRRLACGQALPDLDDTVGQPRHRRRHHVHRPARGCDPHRHRHRLGASRAAGWPHCCATGPGRRHHRRASGRRNERRTHRGRRPRHE